MTEHSKEPWSIDKRHGFVVDADGLFVFDTEEPDDRDIARIVACVNACDGLNPEAIPKVREVATDLCHFPHLAGHAEYLEDLRQALVELEA